MQCLLSLSLLHFLCYSHCLSPSHSLSLLPFPACLCSCLVYSAASTCGNCLPLSRGSCVWRTRGQSRVACGTLVLVLRLPLGATAGAALSPSRLANCALMQSKQIEADRRGDEARTSKRNEAATLTASLIVTRCHPLRRWPCAGSGPVPVSQSGAPATRAAN